MEPNDQNSHILSLRLYGWNYRYRRLYYWNAHIIWLARELGKTPYLNGLIHQSTVLIYISRLLSFYTCTFNTRRATNQLLLDVPSVQSELGKAAFSYFAPSLWNKLQPKLSLDALPSVSAFKGMLQIALQETCRPNCFP